MEMWGIFVLIQAIAGVSGDPEWVDILDEMIPIYMTNYSVPGLTMSFVWGEEVVTRGYGVTSYNEYGQAVTEDTLFNIGSVTKSFTSTLLGKHLAENQHTFHTPIYDVVCPRIVLHDDYITNVTTSRDMLAHVTGMAGYFGSLLGNFGNNISRYEHALRFQDIRHVLPFNQSFFYNNQFYILAGHLVERLNDLNSWEEVMREDIFTPLGMHRTSFAGEVEHRSNVAYPHVLVDGEIVEDSLDIIKVQWNAAAAGSIMSSSADMAKYLRFQLDNGMSADGVQLVPEDIMIETKTPTVPQFSGDGDDINTDYCLGWFFGQYKGYDRLKHGGSFPPHIYALLTLHQTELENFGIFAAASGSNNDVTALLQEIHHFIQDNILEGYSDKLQSSDLQLSKHSNILIDNSYFTVKSEINNGGNQYLFTSSKIDRKQMPGNYTHDGFGTILITDIGNDQFSFQYGYDVKGILSPTSTSNVYSLFLDGVFWSLTAVEGWNTQGYSVTFGSSDGVNVDRLTTDFIIPVFEEYFILDASLPPYEEIPCI